MCGACGCWAERLDYAVFEFDCDPRRRIGAYVQRREVGSAQVFSTAASFSYIAESEKTGALITDFR